MVLVPARFAFGASGQSPVQPVVTLYMAQLMCLVPAVATLGYRRVPLIPLASAALASALLITLNVATTAVIQSWRN